MKATRLSLLLTLITVSLLGTTACSTTSQSDGVTITKERNFGITDTLSKLWPW